MQLNTSIPIMWRKKDPFSTFALPWTNQWYRNSVLKASVKNADSLKNALKGIQVLLKRGLKASDKTEYLDFMIHLLNFSIPEVRAAVKKAAEELGATKEQIFDGYIPGLTSIFKEQRLSAVRAIIKSGDNRAIQALLTASVIEEDQQIQELLVSTIDRFNLSFDQLIDEYIIMSENDRYGPGSRITTDLHSAAAKALGTLGGELAVNALIKMLLKENEEPVVRGSAAKALGKLGNKRAIDALTKVASELTSSPFLRYKFLEKNKYFLFDVSKVLDKLGAEAQKEEFIAYVLKALFGTDEEFIDTAERLGDSKDKRAVDLLIFMLQQPSRWYTIDAVVIKALDKLGDKRAVDPLLDKIVVQQYESKIATIEALGNLGDPKAIESLILELVGFPIYHDAARLALFKLGKDKVQSPLSAEYVKWLDSSEVYMTPGLKGKELDKIRKLYGLP